MNLKILIQIVIVLILAASFSSCIKEEGEYYCDYDKKLVRENNSIFIVENGRRYLVNQNVITVKLKPEIEEIGEEYEVIRSNKLGFIDLLVPEGIDVVNYMCMLKTTGLFELVEINGFGEFGFE